MVRRYAHVNNEMMKKALEQIMEHSPVIFTIPQESKPISPCAPVAQLDRAFDYEKHSIFETNSQLIRN